MLTSIWFMIVFVNSVIIFHCNEKMIKSLKYSIIKPRYGNRIRTCSVPNKCYIILIYREKRLWEFFSNSNRRNSHGLCSWFSLVINMFSHPHFPFPRGMYACNEDASDEKVVLIANLRIAPETEIKTLCLLLQWPRWPYSNSSTYDTM